jgi:hypothetical protein
MKLRSYLSILVLAGVAPLIVLTVVVTVSLARQQRDAVVQGMSYTVDALAMLIENELEISIKSLETLATSRRLDDDDLPQFYSAGSSLTCPASTGGTPGKILFGTIPGVISRSVTVNLATVNLYGQSQTVNVPIKGAFTSFVLNDNLSMHMQAWTYDAILYRDGVKIEAFSKKSPVAFQGSVYVQFTDQPNSFVHGHDWKVEWHYAGPNFQNGSVTFHVP